ncbi:MAG: DUF3179 domain-containing protein [Chloroflexi bacterium]|nr:DUF3179 domain-containing protein [Chloroflexota bacterium]
MYSRIIDGEEYTFGVSGKLIMNILVMYDRQTNSLWSQLLGRAVEGPLAGSELEYLPSWQTTWEDWKTQHPDTLALRKGYSGFRDPYAGYYESDSAGVIGEAVRNNLLYVKEFVIGVEIDGQATAYPFSVLNDEPIVNDLIADTSVLVVFNYFTSTGVVFDRNLNGETLTFSIVSDLTITDDQTGSTWDGLTGTAIDGPLAGETLTRLKSTGIFWFGWSDWFPETEVYGLEN